MRPGIAEVHQQPIAEILGDIPVKVLDDLSAGGLVCPHHLAPVFGVQLTGERRRVHEIAEQHGELAPLGCRSVRFG